MKETYLVKSVKAFLKDEYGLDEVDVSVKVKQAHGTPDTIKRLEHDRTNELDFDLID